MENKKEVKQITITTKDGKPFAVPPEGSLGLLALGHVGLMAWRQSRAAYAEKMKELQAAGKLPQQTEQEQKKQD
ncbi:MAG: hypothetical protein H6548_08030 [Chitinophagales bacterium]|nr:hypothetical protein [Chitinophagales bacterium]HAE13017.1 hypothetical protein [Bacteroidota bacterium]MCB9022050.1 hypothetical protein [Chitinophagales bacterium]MCB9031779.1 hypothetical protein [Chitinophagales bacterium]HPE96627.1 hypothetical protein [Chitinophagales bacterium]